MEKFQRSERLKELENQLQEFCNRIVLDDGESPLENEDEIGRMIELLNQILLQYAKEAPELTKQVLAEEDEEPIGFVPDPRRVDYWTSYSGPKTVAELKTRPVWNTLSDAQKARLEKLDETRAERLRAYHEMRERYFREQQKEVS